MQPPDSEQENEEGAEKAPRTEQVAGLEPASTEKELAPAAEVHV